MSSANVARSTMADVPKRQRGRPPKRRYQLSDTVASDEIECSDGAPNDAVGARTSSLGESQAAAATERQMVAKPPSRIAARPLALAPNFSLDEPISLRGLRSSTQLKHDAASHLKSRSRQSRTSSQAPAEIRRGHRAADVSISHSITLPSIEATPLPSSGAQVDDCEGVSTTRQHVQEESQGSLSLGVPRRSLRKRMPAQAGFLVASEVVLQGIAGPTKARSTSSAHLQAATGLAGRVLMANTAARATVKPPAAASPSKKRRVERMPGGVQHAAIGADSSVEPCAVLPKVMSPTESDPTQDLRGSANRQERSQGPAASDKCETLVDLRVFVAHVDDSLSAPQQQPAALQPGSSSRPLETSLSESSSSLGSFQPRLHIQGAASRIALAKLDAKAQREAMAAFEGSGGSSGTSQSQSLQVLPAASVLATTRLGNPIIVGPSRTTDASPDSASDLGQYPARTLFLRSPSSHSGSTPHLAAAGTGPHINIRRSPIDPAAANQAWMYDAMADAEEMVREEARGGRSFGLRAREGWRIVPYRKPSRTDLRSHNGSSWLFRPIEVPAFRRVEAEVPRLLPARASEAVLIRNLLPDFVKDPVELPPDIGGNAHSSRIDTLHVLDPDMGRLKAYQYLWRLDGVQVLESSEPVVRKATTICPSLAPATQQTLPSGVSTGEFENVTSIVDSGTASAEPLSPFDVDPRARPLAYRFSQIPRLPPLSNLEDTSVIDEDEVAPIAPRIVALRNAPADDAPARPSEKQKRPLKAILSPFTLRSETVSDIRQTGSPPNFDVDLGGADTANISNIEPEPSQLAPFVEPAPSSSSLAKLPSTLTLRQQHLEMALNEAHAAAFDLISEPHVVHGTILPDAELIKQRQLAFGRKFTPYTSDSTPHPRISSRARVSWLIPILGPVLITNALGEAPCPTPAWLCHGDVTDCNPDAPSEGLRWTPSQLAGLWSALCKLARLGRMGPVSLVLHGPSPDPFGRQPPDLAATSAEPTALIGSHIRVYCYFQWATRIRFALEALKLPLHEHCSATGEAGVETCKRSDVVRMVKPFRRSAAKLCLVDARLRVLSVA